jgi:hypothetical protein
MTDEEKSYKRLPPQLQGRKKMNKRWYVWLLDHQGIPQKHWLDEYKSKDKSKDKTKRPKDKS